MESRLALHQRSALTVVAALVLAAAPTARADRKAARPHVERATTDYKAGKFHDALQELTLAYALDSDPELLFAIGQVHVKLGDCASATTFYQRFLDSHPSADEASIARQAIDECARAAANAQPEPLPAPEPQPAPAPPAPAPAPPPAPIVQQPPPPAPTVVVTRASWYRDKLGDTFLVAGIAAGAAGGILYGLALSARDDADHAPLYQSYRDDLDRARSYRTDAIIGASAAGALVVAGIIRYGVHDRSERRTVAAAPTRGGALVTCEVRF